MIRDQLHNKKGKIVKNGNILMSQKIGKIFIFISQDFSHLKFTGGTFCKLVKHVCAYNLNFCISVNVSIPEFSQL